MTLSNKGQCPAAEGQECLAWLYENDYTANRTGPYTDREMYPLVDGDRFLFTAERVIISDAE